MAEIKDFITVVPTGTDLIPVSQNGNTRNATFAKIKKVITADVNTDLSDKVNKTAIVNNLTATVAGSVLDATQGKILNGKIASVGIIYSANSVAKTIPINTEDSVFDWLTLSAGTYLLICSTANFDSTTELRLYKRINSIDTNIAISKGNIMNNMFVLSEDAIVKMQLKTTTNTYTIYGDTKYERLQLIKIA
jgi:hypothetical protein